MPVTSTRSTSLTPQQCIMWILSWTLFKISLVTIGFLAVGPRLFTACVSLLSSERYQGWWSPFACALIRVAKRRRSPWLSQIYLSLMLNSHGHQRSCPASLLKLACLLRVSILTFLTQKKFSLASIAASSRDILWFVSMECSATANILYCRKCPLMRVFTDRPVSLTWDVPNSQGFSKFLLPVICPVWDSLAGEGWQFNDNS